MWRPVTSSGGSLEPSGDGRTQTDDHTRHNPAYRSAYADRFITIQKERDHMDTIVLASKSPRRLELLHQIGISVKVLPSSVEETVTGSTPAEAVMGLSRQKCMDTACKVPEGIILGADTIVVLDGRILGKPEDEQDAFDMLSALSGRSHEVYTGVTIAGKRQDRIFRDETFAVCTRVWFYPMTEEEIRSYISTGDPMDKAGAYGIQGPFARHVEKIEGDYNNVVGLPVSAVYQKLREWGVPGNNLETIERMTKKGV